MKQSLLHFRIPTALGMFMLIALLFGTTMLVRSGILFPIRATNADKPQDLQISNITDTSFTISYGTNTAVTGAITYGETEEYGTVTLDERDSGDNTAKPHTIHAITVKNLKPQTKYFFAIISNGTTYTNNNAPYTVTTAGTLPAPQEKPEIVTGTVMKPDGTKPGEAIVYVSTEGSQTLSSLAKEDGTYTISLKNLRNTSFTSYQELLDESTLTLKILGDGLTASVKVTKGKSNPIPTITLSQNYDFTLAGSFAESPTASESADTTVFPKFTTDQVVNTNPQILTPQEDEEFADLQPQFTGTAPPNRTIEIIINSNHQIRATVRTDKFGNWTYRPNKPLEPGNHTIEIRTKDEAGLTRTIIQTFIVNAQGSQFTEPSVSPVQSPTPTVTPSVTATPSPTSVPTQTVSPTRLPTSAVVPTAVFPTLQPTPTLIPTATLFPTITPLPTKIVIIPTQAINPTIDNAGSNEIMLTVSIATVAMISGAVLFFLTQGIGL